MLYKIIGIKHTGVMGERETDRTDGRYPKRIGRIIWMSDNTSAFGYRFRLEYIADENGNDYSDKICWCSTVQRYAHRPNDIVEVETENSIYILQRVKKIHCE